MQVSVPLRYVTGALEGASNQLVPAAPCQLGGRGWSEWLERVGERNHGNHATQLEPRQTRPARFTGFPVAALGPNPATRCQAAQLWLLNCGCSTVAAQLWRLNCGGTDRGGTLPASTQLISIRASDLLPLTSH